MYLAPIADSSGGPLGAGKTYKLRVPKGMPAKQFWWLTVYDRVMWAFINNPLDRASLGSLAHDPMSSVSFERRSSTGRRAYAFFKKLQLALS